MHFASNLAWVHGACIIISDWIVRCQYTPGSLLINCIQPFERHRLKASNYFHNIELHNKCESEHWNKSTTSCLRTSRIHCLSNNQRGMSSKTFPSSRLKSLQFVKSIHDWKILGYFKSRSQFPLKQQIFKCYFQHRIFFY